ncbi:MAG TPA: regulatory protein RecX [Candidatus Limnocylindrales bacterium]|nr:regulatory protein RecX [Candidatus Limnocylindrales bacterium]
MSAARRRGATAAALRARRATVDDPAIILDAAAAFLAVRPRSVAETRQRLRHLGYRDDLIETVLARLLGLGYLDDEAFGRAWLESRDRARPRGRHVLRRELRLKGLDPDLVARLLAERDEPEDGVAVAAAAAAGAGSADLTAATRLLGRRRAALEREADPRRRRQKAYALLARNGFDPDVIGQALAEMARDVSPGAEGTSL